MRAAGTRTGREEWTSASSALGRMGFHMVRRLIEAGHTLDRVRHQCGRGRSRHALGARAAASPAEVADAVETVMASLPTPDIVLAVATGERGVIEGKRVRRFVDLSTTGAAMAMRVFDALKARNIVQIDSSRQRRRRRRREGHARGDGVGTARRRRSGRAGAQGDRQGVPHRRAARRRADDEARSTIISRRPRWRRPPKRW